MSAGDLLQAGRRGVAMPRLARPARRGGALAAAPLIAALVAIALGVGYLVGNGDVKVALALLLPIAALLVAFDPRASGPVIAFAVLMVMNGIPVVDLGKRLPGNLQVQDAGALALIVLLLIYRDRQPSALAVRYE